MANFWLIQRGTFKKESPFVPGGIDSIVGFDYMGSAEFEWGALPKAYRRIMYHFNEYGLHNTGIYTPEHEELLVFCKKDCSEGIIEAIKEYIAHPYSLKEFSCLDTITKSKKDSWDRKHCDFWWCIDRNETIGNWMALLEPRRDLFNEIITANYHNWWLLKSPEERETEYRKALDW